MKKKLKKNEHDRITDMIINAGMQYDGVTSAEHLPKNLKEKGSLYWFTDMKTGSTLSMYAKEFTPEKLQAHIDTPRKAFCVKGERL